MIPRINLEKKKSLLSNKYTRAHAHTYIYTRIHYRGRRTVCFRSSHDGDNRHVKEKESSFNRKRKKERRKGVGVGEIKKKEPV